MKFLFLDYQSFFLVRKESLETIRGTNGTIEEKNWYATYILKRNSIIMIAEGEWL